MTDPIADGHALIDRHFLRAQKLDSHPAVRALLPLMQACFHDLFAHMTKPVAGVTYALLPDVMTRHEPPTVAEVEAEAPPAS